MSTRLESMMAKLRQPQPGTKRKAQWKRERGVQDTAELQRILSLERRPITDEAGAYLVDQLTALLRTPHGQQKLRPVQAFSLHDLALKRGVFCSVRVGAGKTLISFLAPYMVNSVRPLLLIPAKLQEKTKRDLNFFSDHWFVCPHLRMLTYESLGRVSHAEVLNTYQPDLIIADEVHRLKNLRAAVTKRVRRYMESKPDTIFCALSGTITKRSILDYAHILHWTHGGEKPLPNRYVECEEWSLALDEKINALARMEPGALLQLCNDEEQELRLKDERSAVRRAYRRRMAETEGVITTVETFQGASISIDPLKPSVRETTNELFDRLRQNWETPDGWPISDPVGIFKHARELSQGFFYRWNPRPPEEWMEARRSWAAFVRKVIQRNPYQLDSELQVAQAVARRGLYADQKHIYDEWSAIEPTFKPNVEAVWVDDSVLEAAARWMLRNKGIVWVEHVTVGRRLSSLTGVNYYGRRGQTETGDKIEDADPRKPLICSIASNSEGRNLQAWNTNLIMSPMSSGDQWEQLLGRTHRDGQEADEIGVDVMLSCREHVRAWSQALRDAKYQQDTTGQVQKILFADSTMPSDDVALGPESRWR